MSSHGCIACNYPGCSVWSCPICHPKEHKHGALAYGEQPCCFSPGGPPCGIGCKCGCHTRIDDKFLPHRAKPMVCMSQEELNAIKAAEFKRGEEQGRRNSIEGNLATLICNCDGMWHIELKGKTLYFDDKDSVTYDNLERLAALDPGKGE